MTETDEQHVARTRFTRETLGPVFDEFSRKVKADAPAPETWKDGEKRGYRIKLPYQVADKAQYAFVGSEPKDEDAFGVLVSRPDEPSQLREIALVRYDDLEVGKGPSEDNRVGGLVRNALSLLRQTFDARKS